jgi:tetratricopeptide (TPR) repeat protein
MILLALLFLGQEPIEWRTDVPLAVAESRREKKLLLIHFFVSGRPACAAMEEETLRNPEVARRVRERLVALKVDVGARPDLFRETIGGGGGLASALLDETGDVVSILPGFADRESFLSFLLKGLEGRGRLREAREARAANPEDVAALHALAETYHGLGSSRRAEECFEKILARPEGKAPAPPEIRFVAFAHERLARARILRGKNQDAREHLREYLKLDPDNRFGRHDRILFTEALVLAVERRLKESIRRVESILAKFPSAEETDQMLVLEGWVEHEDGNDPRALAILEGMVARFTGSPWLGLAKERIAHIKNPPPDHSH